MRAKRYSVEQIVAKLREAEKLQGQGLTIPQACKRLGISDQTFYRWRIRYGALKEDEPRVPPRRSQASGKRAQGTAENAIWNLPATGPNHIWSYDFMSGRTRDGASLRILNVVDEYTRVALGCRVDRSIGASDVADELERLFDRHERPRVLRSDNGREFIAASLLDWLAERGVQTAFIEKRQSAAKPVRGALQRHDARRAPERRRVQQPRRGQGGDQRLGRRVQHHAPPPRARHDDT
jgi:transposase InsO family protein